MITDSCWVSVGLTEGEISDHSVWVSPASMLEQIVNSTLAFDTPFSHLGDS